MKSAKLGKIDRRDKHLLGEASGVPGLGLSENLVFRALMLEFQVQSFGVVVIL